VRVGRQDADGLFASKLAPDVLARIDEIVVAHFE
jgi:hypothetical protein